MSDSNRDAQHELARIHRSFGPISPTLYNMPINIVDQVLEKLEPMDRLKIRKVCRNLRTCVDRFGIHFNYIIFHIWKNAFELGMDGFHIRYTDAENGGSTVRKDENQETPIEGASSMKIAFQDLKTVLKHTSELRISNEHNEHEIIKSFIEILKSVKCIHVKTIKLVNFSFNDVITILQYCNTKVLESIALWDTHINRQFENIAHLDQWKCAKKCSLFGDKLENKLIDHLFHFQWFQIQLDDFPTYIAIKIRDDLMRRSTFQGCQIYCDTSKSNPIEIAKVFKPDYDGGNEFEIDYSNDNANFKIQFNSFRNSSSRFDMHKL
ncbi:F-box domain-containing protein [Caenorhabditis elegans]|uniref:F-box domain-containing protein n=1 Tax=Caenorhabditis elegans TaxID=6239 RepID=Q9TZ24_CAEEL|nr:F-box domain-containing protein [Caenorhabditis elegans]CCD73260.1 F-box domain-containing protein [Caenorhabditis elegans]|eukprot:NP_497302.1 F-box A protein [Caenorhabditis elegans]